MIHSMNAKSDDVPTNEDKIGRWSSQWRQDQTMIQPMKVISDSVSQNEIGRWYNNQGHYIKCSNYIRTIYCLQWAIWS